MLIQLHVICIFVLFMKHQDVHIDWFMWTKVSYVWIDLGYCRKICLRISRAAAVTKICSCRHPRALPPKYRLLWKKPPWWYFHVFQWRSIARGWKAWRDARQKLLVWLSAAKECKTKESDSTGRKRLRKTVRLLRIGLMMVRLINFGLFPGERPWFQRFAYFCCCSAVGDNCHISSFCTFLQLNQLLEKNALE